MQSRDELSKLAGKLGGLPILGCRPHSPAALAGIRYGDILLAVNGQPVPDWSAYVAARALDPRQMEVEVFRGGERHLHRLPLDRAEPVDPYTLLGELIDERILPSGGDGDGEPPPDAPPS